MMTEVVSLFNINKFNIILDSLSLIVAKICNLIKKVKKNIWNHQIIFCRHIGYAALRRQCEVAQPCPARYSEWVARTSFAAPSSGQRWDSSRHRQSSNCSFWLSQVLAVSNCQASKAPKPELGTEGRWPRATPRRRVQSTNSAPLTLMEIRFVKVGSVRRDCSW